MTNVVIKMVSGRPIKETGAKILLQAQLEAYSYSITANTSSTEFCTLKTLKTLHLRHWLFLWQLSDFNFFV